MTAKEQNIKEAYGEHWEAVKKFVDENGWVNTETDGLSDETFNAMRLFLAECDMKGIMKFRPKQLYGIENNAGWTRIESEADLPKEYGLYWLYLKTGMIGTRFIHNGIKKWEAIDIFQEATHYQLVIKPQPPIY